MEDLATWKRMGEETVTGFNLEFDEALRELRDGWYHPDYLLPIGKSGRGRKTGS